MLVRALQPSAWIIKEVLLDMPDDDPEQWHRVRGEGVFLPAGHTMRRMIGGQRRINKSSVTTSSPGLAADKEWNWFSGIFITCIVSSRGTHLCGCSFPSRTVGTADYQTVKRQSDSPHVWCDLQASGCLFWVSCSFMTVNSEKAGWVSSSVSVELSSEDQFVHVRIAER